MGDTPAIEGYCRSHSGERRCDPKAEREELQKWALSPWARHDMPYMQAGNLVRDMCKIKGPHETVDDEKDARLERE